MAYPFFIESMYNGAVLGRCEKSPYSRNSRLYIDIRRSYVVLRLRKAALGAESSGTDYNINTIAFIV